MRNAAIIAYWFGLFGLLGFLSTVNLDAMFGSMIMGFVFGFVVTLILTDD